jgi:L-ascorbate metabolism protein UlaG (beta-lactamase superfamily)
MQITWLGHATWSIATGQHTLLIDPFLDGNPAAAAKADDVAADFILLTHGHVDHVADAVKIAKRTGATVIANYEIAEWLGKQGVGNAVGMNLGGWGSFPFGRAKMTVALHSSTLPDGSPGGNPGGYLLVLGEMRIYIAGDTALFSDMRLIGAAGIDLAILPIGDFFTMGPDDSIEAIRLLDCRRVAPSHYNTWPPIAQDAHHWADRVRRETQCTPFVLEPGGKIEV